MADRAERAQSFGTIAPDYDRLRPTAPDAALDWLVPADCRTAVDLAAGTGLFTRALARRVPELIAVEPDERMRAVLGERTSGVRVVDGRGEAIPLADASVDAVFVSSAWHWMDPGRAVPEIARVLRDGGRFGVLWTGRNRDVEWVRDFETAAMGIRAERPPGMHRDVTLPNGHLFERIEQASFPFRQPMRIDDLVGSLATYSQLIVLEAADRLQALDRARASLIARFGETTDIEVPMGSRCWRADRVPRSNG